jgi:hypothetical protein
MTVRHFINRKNLLSSDTQPLPENLRTVLLFEDDTGDLILSDGTSTTVTQSNKNVQTWANKGVDAEKNSFNGLIEYTPFALTDKATGGIIPASTVADSFFGFLEDGGVSLYNPDSVLNLDPRGMVVLFKGLGIGQKIGFASIVPIARRGDGYEFKLEFQSNTNLQTLIGFSATKDFPTHTTIFNTTDIGICVGFTDNDAKFSIFTNDGAGAAAVPIPFTIDKDKLFHTVEIILSSSKAICTLDNETIEVTNKLPPLTTNLYLSIYGIM